jgi:hypothetical protein
MISLFENATEGIILTGGHGKIVLVNLQRKEYLATATARLLVNPLRY